MLLFACVMLFTSLAYAAGALWMHEVNMNYKNLQQRTKAKMNTYTTKSGKTYTKKQICEAIAYWKKQLKKLNESALSSKVIDVSGISDRPDLYLVSFSDTGYQNGDTWYAISTREQIPTVIKSHMESVDVDSSLTGFGADVDRVVKNIMANVDNVNAFSDENYNSKKTSVSLGGEDYVTIDVKKLSTVDNSISAIFPYLLYIAG